MDVYIETYGCSVNQDDSNIMKGLLQRSGFSISGEESADIIIVNTCAVKHTTEQKILHRIRQLRERWPGKKIVVAGCMPASGQYEFPEADGILGTNAGDILTLLRRMERGRAEIVGSGKKLGFPKFSINDAIQPVQISQGCLSHCTYCITKLSRGELHSFPVDGIVDEVRKAVAAGRKEIWLTSQDNSVYGMDIGTSLPGLLETILEEVKGDYRIRIGMANPTFSRRYFERLLEIMADERVYKFLHLPVQSGSDRILVAMKRGYLSESFRKMAVMAREMFPEMNLWTDMIVGYPGESEEDFRLSMRLLKETKPDFCNISRFSPRPGTEAMALKKLPTETVKERTREMSSLVRRISRARNEQWVGWRGKALITEWNAAHGTWIGRNYAYKQLIITNLGRKDTRLGKWVEVEAYDAIETGIYAEAV